MKLQVQLESDFSLHLRLICILRSVADEISAFPLKPMALIPALLLTQGQVAWWGCEIPISIRGNIWRNPWLVFSSVGIWPQIPGVLQSESAVAPNSPFQFPQLQLDSQGILCSFLLHALKWASLELWCDVPSASNSVAKAHQPLLEMAGFSTFAVSFLVNTDGGQG